MAMATHCKRHSILNLSKKPAKEIRVAENNFANVKPLGWEQGRLQRLQRGFAVCRDRAELLLCSRVAISAVNPFGVLAGASASRAVGLVGILCGFHFLAPV